MMRNLPRTCVISMRVTRETRAQLERLAELRGQSLTTVVERAIHQIFHEGELELKENVSPIRTIKEARK